MVRGRHRHALGCTHRSTVSVISGGVERVICEQCGDMTIRYESMISGDVDRKAFARRSEGAFLKNLIELSLENDSDRVNPTR